MEKYVINDSIFLFQLICAGLCGTALEWNDRVE